jgi:pimeloyl-ACP methyl ester carboxylesterase
VLLVHGFSGSTFSWEAIAPALQAAGFHTVAVDVPPFGYSDRSPESNASVTARARLLLGFLEAAGPGRPWHLVGHSMGGGVVQAMALMRPAAVASVTFVAGTVFGEVAPGKAGGPSPTGLRPGQALLGALAGAVPITPEQVGALLESAYGRPPTPEQIRGYLAPLSIPGTTRAIVSTASAAVELEALDAGALRIPALAIWGERDTWVPLEKRRPALERIPGLRLRVIPAAGHCPMETHPAEFLAHLLPFLGEGGEAKKP